MFPGLVPPPILVAVWASYCAFIQATDMFVESSAWLFQGPSHFLIFVDDDGPSIHSSLFLRFKQMLPNEDFM